MSIGAPYRNDIDVETLGTMTGDATLTMEDADTIHADGGGSVRDITLPAVAMGAKVVIVNTGGEALTVNDPDGVTANEVVDTNEVGTFFCNGTVWLGTTAIHGS